MPILFHDFETRSTLDLKRVGAWKYSTHPFTDVRCCAYAVDDGEVKIWRPGMPVPSEFIEAANSPDWLTSAFNDQFERLITTHIMAPRYGWPIIPIERRRCSMAMSLAMALPGKLEHVAEALDLINRKDKAGHALMLRMARPRKPRKDEDPEGIYWLDDPERIERVCAYCRQDVAVERELHGRLRPLTADELDVWQLDARINSDGFHVDAKLALGMVEIAEISQARINEELERITGGVVTSVGQTKKLTAWLAQHDCVIKDVQKGTLGHALRRKDIEPEARRAIELRLEGAHIATSKPRAVLGWANGDKRVRGAFTFHGASTGRWASHGIQAQNFVRCDSISAEVIEDLASGDYDRVKIKHGNPLAVVGGAVRALVTAAPGHGFLAGDFSGIESRVTAWVSGQQSVVDQWAKFDSTGDPKDEPYYLQGIRFGVPEADARKAGKGSNLAFGFAGGVRAWRNLYPDDPRSDEEIQKLLDAWQQENPKIVAFWNTLVRASVAATRNPGKTVPAGRYVTFEYDGTHLYCRLPSGRSPTYPFASLMTNKWGKLVVTFKDNKDKKWVDCNFGHGSRRTIWIENVVQAISRDLLVAGMLQLEAAGYKIVFHVHDEIVTEMPDGGGSMEEFRERITMMPGWAPGLPIAAKVRKGPRFCKVDGKADEPEPPPWEASGEDSPAGATEEEPAGEETADVAPKASDNVTSFTGGSRSRWNGYAHGEEEYGNQVAEYIYEDQFGQPYLKVVKYVAGNGKKQYPQYHREGGKWVNGAPSPRIPYRLPELLAAKTDIPVCIGEGEKVADALAALGFTATTNPEGAGKFGTDLVQYFVGRSTVYLFEGNDAPGREHVAQIADALRGTVPDIFVVRFTDLGEKEDVADWLDAYGHTKADLLERMKAAPRAEATLAKKYTLVCAADIVPRPIDWVWEHHLARGHLEMLTGLPGQGKSQVQCSYAACGTTGCKWPNGANGIPPGTTIMLTAEDNLEQVLIPRLIAAGADLGRVHILKKIRKDNKDRMFLLAEDIEELAAAIAEKSAMFVSADPITAYMGSGRGFDSHRTTDVRSQLGPLAELAERTNVVFSAVTHPPKSAGPRSLDWFIGSQAYIAAARLAHLCIDEMEDDGSGGKRSTGRMLYASVPKNLAPKHTPAHAYRIEEVRVLGNIKTTRIVWEDQIDMTADEAIAAAKPGKEPRGANIMTFLQDILAAAPVLKKVITDRAALRGISDRQLQYAADKLGIVQFREKAVHGRSFWALPQHAPKEEE